MSDSMQLSRADGGDGWNVQAAGKAQAGAERPKELGLPGKGTSPGRRLSLPMKAGVRESGQEARPSHPPRHTSDAKGRSQDCQGGSQPLSKLT